MKKLLLILFLSVVTLFLVGCEEAPEGEFFKMFDDVYAIVPELKNEKYNLFVD